MSNFDICTNCNGTGRVWQFDESFPCGACDETGNASGYAEPTMVYLAGGDAIMTAWRSAGYVFEYDDAVKALEALGLPWRFESRGSASRFVADDEKAPVETVMTERGPRYTYRIPGDWLEVV